MQHRTRPGVSRNETHICVRTSLLSREPSSGESVRTLAAAGFGLWPVVLRLRHLIASLD
jgi:hypothetical protein